MSWKRGDVIVWRDVVRAGPWFGAMVHVVQDTAEALVTYLPEATPFGCPDGDWPIEGGRHPWAEKGSWQGNGVLMVTRPGDACSVWHFWQGTERNFHGWYVNLQEPLRRTPVGYDSSDLELDIWVHQDGTWTFKDLELLPQRVAEGRWTHEEVRAVRALGARLGARLDAGERWWDARWAAWTPDPAFTAHPLPEGWERVPFTSSTLEADLLVGPLEVPQ